MNYPNALASLFEATVANAVRQLDKSYDLPDASAGAFAHARAACEEFATAESVGANFDAICGSREGEQELTSVSERLIEARLRLNSCCEAQAVVCERAGFRAGRA